MHPDILIIPHPKLRQKALPIVEFDTDMLFTISNSMLSALDHYKAVGLACTQIGLPMCMITAKPDGKVFTMLNPKIIDKQGEYASKEGCLSIPGYWEAITRSGEITVEYQDITGKVYTDYLFGYEAAVIQHEIDHLEGILFIDQLNSIKRDRARKKVEHWKRQNRFKHKMKRNV